MSEVKQYYIGWDVGAWYCDENSKSRDAIVILDSESNVIGIPCRKNIADEILSTINALGFVKELFRLCKCLEKFYEKDKFLIAIDTPLGYSEGFVKLVTNKGFSDFKKGDEIGNPYLFRETERRIAKEFKKSLSAVTHMIGSQSTKGMHALAKFANNELERTGVWKAKEGEIFFIETYPAVQEKINMANLDAVLSEKIPAIGISKRLDIVDAYKCAVIAYEFDNDKEREIFHQPEKDIPIAEGWIWAKKKN